MGVCNCSMFCCTLLYVHSSIAIILMGKRELIALLNLSSWCLVMVERLFLAVPRGCLQFVIVVFPDHTHLLSFYVLVNINLWGWRRITCWIPPVKYFTDRSKGVLFIDLVCFFCLVFVMPLCAPVYLCLVVTCWEKGWPLWILWCIIVSLSLSTWYPGSGVVLDCIDSWAREYNASLKLRET